MANEEHLAVLREGVDAWNAWREKDPFIIPDLSEAGLSGKDLFRANLSGANLRRADLNEADFRAADLSMADVSEADLSQVDLSEADLRKADFIAADLLMANLSQTNLSRANLGSATLIRANLSKAILSEANLKGAILVGADLNEANLDRANLSRADVSEANFKKATLSRANFQRAILIETNLEDADLTGSRVYGISAWDLKLEGAIQRDLVITKLDEPEITVDNLEVAQFIYLLIYNKKIRDVIDTMTSKVVLILGSFTDERKTVLDALRDELRNKHDYVPVLFDFKKPANLTTDETITLLARMARFVIADITDAKSVLQELRAIVPDTPSLAVQPITFATQEEPGMFDFYRGFRGVLPAYCYTSPEQLIADIRERVIGPAEAKVRELRG